MNIAVHFSSKTDMWSTPQGFFDALDKEFQFDLDPCATKENAKCKLFYSEGGLEKSWDGYRVFCNPPYGREIGKWVKKASETVGGGSRYAFASSNRYAVVSRMYLRQIRNTFYSGEIEVW